MAKGSLPGAVLGERLAKLVLTKSSAQRWSTTLAIPRSLYPPIPAQMKLSLRLHQASQYHINIAGTTYTGISSCSPIGIGGMYPEGLQL